MSRFALSAAALALAGGAWMAMAAASPVGGSPSRAVSSPTLLQAAPAIVVMGSYKCDRARTAELDEYVRTVQAPIMEAMVEEGWVLDWGYLAHHYGDEWNRVVYYVSESLPRHVEFSAEVTRRMGEARPGEVSPFTLLCFEHKDNIYDRVFP